jgi:cell division protein FtsI/penicillin-binding protein 2
VKKGRVYILLAFTLLGYGAVIAKLYKIQIWEHDRFVALAERQSNQSMRLERERGTIYDRRGRELAVSLRVRSLAANPRKFTVAATRAAVARKLAGILGAGAEAIDDRLARDGEFAWIARKLPAEKAEAIAALEIPGLFFQTEYRRHYPHDSTAAHVVGFVGMDDVGLDGVEKARDAILRGPEVEGRYVHDAHGNPVPVDGMVRYPKFDGNSVHLTIDLVIQTALEEALARQVEAFGAKSASGIVVDPATGEILALANVPTFNLNDVARSSADDRRNRALTDLFEPGSTFKVFSGATALTENAVKPEDEFLCQGAMPLKGHTVKCHHTHGTVDYRRAIEVSCNVAAMTVAMRMNPAALYAGLRAYGFGQRTGIELPGEAAGVLRPVEKWSGFSLAMLSLGQEISVTTLQLAIATSSLANGGRLMAPHIVQSVRDVSGRSIRSFPPEVRSRPVNPRTARLMGSIMEGVVRQGTGMLAAVPPFPASGKTGTAQISGPQGGYIDGRYNSVFIGWTPTEAPVLAMAIVIRDPDPAKGYYGGLVAAPVFGWVGAEAMRYLRVAAPAPMMATSSPAGAGAGTTRTPAASERRTGSVHDGKVEVPDLRGLTLREAHELLTTLPLGFHPRGSGVAVSQSIEPGTLVPIDASLKVEFAPPGGSDRFADVAG